MCGHADVGAPLQHHGRNAKLQVLCVEHTFCSISLSLSMVQDGGAPFLTADVLWSDSQQLADEILNGTDVAASIYYLSLNAQVGSLHLVDGGAICLTVLPESLLRLE